MKRQDRQGRQLPDEGLGRGHPELGPAVGVEVEVRRARDRGAHRVADREDLGALLLGQAHRSQGVGGLAGLADHDNKLARAHRRLAVAELRGGLGLDAHARHFLDPVLADQGGVVGGAAGDHAHRADILQNRAGEASLALEHAVLERKEPPPHRVLAGGRLFVDLLEHEMPKAPLLGHRPVPLDLDRGPLDPLAGEVEDRAAVRLQDRHLAVIEEDRLARVGEEGRNVRGEEVLPLPQADDEGGGGLRRDDDARGLGPEHGQGVGSRVASKRRGSVKSGVWPGT